MTVITVRSPAGRLNGDQRRKLAQTLTDAVMVPEIGQFVEAARAGFQVHFVELADDAMAIGGVLISDRKLDVMLIDVAVMDGDWPKPVRATVIERIFAAMAEACGVEKAASGWWVNFRVIDEGSWGSRGGVISIFDLLQSGAFSERKAAAIHAAVKR